MEKEQEQVTPQDSDFIKGMNEGYYLAKYLPEVADGLYKIISDNDRIQGFKAGREEYIKEKVAERMKSWDKEERNKDWEILNDKDIKKTLDDLEREME